MVSALLQVADGHPVVAQAATGKTEHEVAPRSILLLSEETGSIEEYPVQDAGSHSKSCCMVGDVTKRDEQELTTESTIPPSHPKKRKSQKVGKIRRTHGSRSGGRNVSIPQTHLKQRRFR